MDTFSWILSTALASVRRRYSECLFNIMRVTPRYTLAAAICLFEWLNCTSTVSEEFQKNLLITFNVQIIVFSQDNSLSWYTNGSTPDVTVCFQNSVIAWIPCAFIWLVSPLEIYYLLSAQRSYTPWTWLNLTKVVSSVSTLEEGRLFIMRNMREHI